MSAPHPVAINLHARRAFPWMAGIVLAMPGVIIEDEGSGIRVRVLPDGSLEELGEVPRRRSIAADPTATRRQP